MFEISRNSPYVKMVILVMVLSVLILTSVVYSPMKPKKLTELPTAFSNHMIAMPKLFVQTPMAVIHVNVMLDTLVMALNVLTTMNAVMLLLVILPREFPMTSGVSTIVMQVLHV